MAGKPGRRIGNVRTNNSYSDNGIITSKNGYSGTGLLCNKGQRLYDTSVERPIFPVPEDTDSCEYFEGLTQEVAPGVMPYYAVSNYGRLINKYTGKVMKENVRPTGYGYYCLASEKGQTKYTSHVIIARTFLNDIYKEDEQLQVNHINGNKLDNYINKRMPDGSIKSNLEWTTPKENIRKSIETGLRDQSARWILTFDEVKDICERLQNHETVTNISRSYPQVTYNSIRNIKNKTAWTHISKDYDF